MKLELENTDDPRNHQGGTAIKKFLSSQSMLPYIGSELSKKTDQPIVFKLDQTGSGRRDSNDPNKSKGYILLRSN